MPARDDDVRCPRCGYELRGEVARWTDACPLDGSCNECGLAFPWAEIFSHARHPWLFEVEWRHRPLRRIGRTLCASLRPRWMWGSVRMTDRTTLGPPIVLVGLVFLVFTATYTAWAAYDLYEIYGGRNWRRLPSITGYDWLDYPLRAAAGFFPWMLKRMAAPLVLLVGMPLAFLTIPVTLRRARVRPAHIARIWIYSLVLPIGVVTVWMVVQFVSQMLGLVEVQDATNPWILIRRFVGVVDSLTLVVLRNAIVSLLFGAITVAWIATWWSYAFRHYLGLDRPGSILFTMLLMVGLAALCLEFWVSQVW